MENPGPVEGVRSRIRWDLRSFPIQTIAGFCDLLLPRQAKQAGKMQRCVHTDAVTILFNSSRCSLISFNFIYFNSFISSCEGFKILSNTGFKSWNNIFSKMPNFRLWLKKPIYISGISTLPSTERFPSLGKGMSFAHSTEVKLWQVGH